MSWYRKNPLFAFGMAVCSLLAVGELALIYERWAESRAIARKLEQRKVELQGMAELAPPPTREVATAIEADLGKAQKALASMQAELKGRGPAAERIHNAKVPAARTDAYFDLATYVEKTRELAKKFDVELRPEASRFGFAAFANEGPVLEHMEPVFRQRQLAQYLVESLLEARPRALLAVKREQTITKAEREVRAAAAAAAAANGEVPPEISADSGESGPDYFTIDSRVSARVPNYIDTTAFRFVFTGQTAALRTFLNRLASFELPVLVREVEVEVASAEEATAQAPTEETAAADSAAAVAAAAPASVVLAVGGAAAPTSATKATAPKRPSTAAPIVTKPLSKYTVTVEFVELVPTPGNPADAAAATPTT
ncbi:MAG: hypothetical protein EXS37_16560 [Opitutus sp.]|nr:hypothetical protein [Opitutus sp.]